MLITSGTSSPIGDMHELSPLCRQMMMDRCLPTLVYAIITLPLSTLRLAFQMDIVCCSSLNPVTGGTQASMRIHCKHVSSFHMERGQVRDSGTSDMTMTLVYRPLWVYI